MNKKKHIKVLFSHDALEDSKYESAWAVKTKQGVILDNILFYAKEFSLGDLIKVEEYENEYYAVDLIEESGNSTIRILFNNKDQVNEIRGQLKEKGCESELSNLDNLISVNIPKNVNYKKIKKYLDEGEEKKMWEYQEACLSNMHKNQCRKN